MTRHRFINAPKLIALALLIALTAAACTSDSEGTINLGDGEIVVDSDIADESVAAPESNGEVAEFSYGTADGRTLNFSDLSDGPVVINFFASWCPSCIAEMPDFETVYQELGTDVEFLGLAMQDRTQSAVELVAETGVTYPFGLDPDGEAFAQFGGLGMPTTVFINAAGTVERIHSGQLDADGLAKIINDDLLS